MNFILSNYQFIRPNGQSTGDYTAVRFGALSTDSQSSYINSNGVEITKSEWNTVQTTTDMEAALSELIKSKLLSALDDNELVFFFSAVNENNSMGTAIINFSTSGNPNFGNGYIRSTIDEWHVARTDDTQIVELIKQKIAEELNS